MGWILQPANDAESVAAMKLLLKTGECKFDLAKIGDWLRPTGFDSRCCLPQEKKYHSCLGEEFCGPWEIGQNTFFYGALISGGCLIVRQSVRS